MKLSSKSPLSNHSCLNPIKPNSMMALEMTHEGYALRSSTIYLIRKGAHLLRRQTKRIVSLHHIDSARTLVPYLFL